MENSEAKYTPLDYAINAQHDRIAQLLIEHGGLGIEGIRYLAVLKVQATFRGFRARKRFLSLRDEDKVCLTAMRSRNLALLCSSPCPLLLIISIVSASPLPSQRKKTGAAIIIQSNVRGFLQRRKYKVLLAEQRQKKRSEEVRSSEGLGVPLRFSSL